MLKDDYETIKKELIDNNSDESSSCCEDKTVDPKKDKYKNLCIWTHTIFY